MKKSVVLVGALIVASAAVVGEPAKAADLYGGSIKDEPVYTPPAFSWTGMYFGGHAGYQWGSMDGSDLLGLVPTSLDTEGWLGGIQLGYNHQFGRNIVVGTEISGSWGDTDSSGNCYGNLFAGAVPDGGKISCNGGQDWTVQWLNKMGLAFGTDNRMLVYAIGGVAISDLSFGRQYTQWAAGDLDALYKLRSSGSQTGIGVVLGAGFQYAFASNWSLGVEWLHTEYASADIQGGLKYSCAGVDCAGPAVDGLSTSIGPTAHQQLGTDTVRAVVNFKFN